MAAADFRLRPFDGSGTCQNWHVCIYVAIGVMLFSGFAMAYFAASDVVIGAKAEGVLTMSTRFSFLRGVHLAGLVVLARLLILHLVGACWHRFVRRDGILESISLFKRDIQDEQLTRGLA